MEAIEFVARRGEGSLERGAIPADAGETVVNMGTGLEFSLNLSPGDMQSYSKQGNNLEITLADGRIIVLEGYFVGAGDAPNRLFISSGGTLSELSFIEGADGALFAQYGSTAEWGKWSPDDDLIFLDDTPIMLAGSIDGEEDVSMLGAGLLGGVLGGTGLATGTLVAAGAGAAVLGTGFSAESSSEATPAENPTADPTTPTPTPTVPVTPTPTPTVPVTPTPTDPTRIPPTVNGTGRTDEYGGDNLTVAEKTVTVTGTAMPGSSVTVELGGNSQTVTAGDDGTWSATFEGNNFPPDGTYTTSVTVVEPDGTSTDLSGQTVHIDTVTTVDTTSGTGSAGYIVNGADMSDGIVTVGGTGEAGATIAVTANGVTHSTVVGAGGAWTVDFTSAEMGGGGERTVGIDVLATDVLGNTFSINDTVVIDTVTAVIATSGTARAGHTVNATDLGDGTVTVGGFGEAGASVTVTANGVSHTTTVAQNRTWSLDFTDREIGGGGDRTVPITISTTDIAGNSRSITDSIVIDTVVNADFNAGVSGGADHVANDAELASGRAGLVLTGTSDAGTTAVSVEMNGVTRSATVQPNGDWSVTFEPGTYAVGTNTYQAMATATDPFGNTGSAQMSVRVDTEVTNLTADNSTATGADGIVGLDDADGGITLSGTMEADWSDLAADSQLFVTWQGVNYPATVNQATGQWSVDIPESAVPSGFEGQVTYTLNATDAAGNTATLDQAITIDTLAPGGLDLVTYSAGVNNGALQYSEFVVEAPGDTVGIARVEQDGTINVLAEDQGAQLNDYGVSAVRGQPTQLRLALDDPMSNGQNLIIKETDDAGNTSGTYVVLEGGAAVQDVSNAGLGAHNIETIDLGAADTTLTLTEADILALSSNTDVVKIRGEAAGLGEADSGDAVNIAGATANGQTTDADGVTYNVYDLGGSTVWIDEDITSVNIV